MRRARTSTILAALALAMQVSALVPAPAAQQAGNAGRANRQAPAEEARAGRAWTYDDTALSAIRKRIEASLPFRLRGVLIAEKQAALRKAAEQYTQKRTVANAYELMLTMCFFPNEGGECLSQLHDILVVKALDAPCYEWERVRTFLETWYYMPAGYSSEELCRRILAKSPGNPLNCEMFVGFSVRGRDGRNCVAEAVAIADSLLKDHPDCSFYYGEVRAQAHASLAVATGKAADFDEALSIYRELAATGLYKPQWVQALHQGA